MPTLKELGGLNEKDILFIKEQIAGPIDYKTGLTLKNIPRNDKEWRYLGRTEDKSFLYEIVANKISGMNCLIHSPCNLVFNTFNISQALMLTSGTTSFATTSI